MISITARLANPAIVPIYTNGEGRAAFQLQPGSYTVTAEILTFLPQRLFLYLGSSTACQVDFTMALDRSKMETIY